MLVMIDDGVFVAYSEAARFAEFFNQVQYVRLTSCFTADGAQMAHELFSAFRTVFGLLAQAFKRTGHQVSRRK